MCTFIKGTLYKWEIIEQSVCIKLEQRKLDHWRGELWPIIFPLNQVTQSMVNRSGGIRISHLAEHCMKSGCRTYAGRWNLPTPVPVCLWSTRKQPWVLSSHTITCSSQNNVSCKVAAVIKAMYKQCLWFLLSFLFNGTIHMQILRRKRKRGFN